MGCGSTPHRTSYSLPVFFPPPPTGVSSSSAREARQEVEVQSGDGCTYPKWPSKLGMLGVSCLEGARVLLIHALIEHRVGHQPWASGLYPLGAHLQVGKTISSPPRSLNMAVTLRCRPYMQKQRRDHVLLREDQGFSRARFQPGRGACGYPGIMTPYF